MRRVNQEFDVDCSGMAEHQAGRVGTHVGFQTFGNVAEKQAPFMAVQVKRGAGAIATSDGALISCSRLAT